MADTKIANMMTSDYTNSITNFSIDPSHTDGASDQEETTWINDKYSTYLGYYRTVPELQSAINAIARWTVGKGIAANPAASMVLMDIKGFGKDTFNSIIENNIRTYHLGGDSYNEIITDNKGMLINLKPLDPETMKHVANRKGIIKRFEQWSKTGTKKLIRKFKPEEIFYLARNRVADEIHGTSMIPALENIILALREARKDYQLLLHRNVFPVRLWHADSDNAADLAVLKAKIAAAKGNFEDIIVPKGAVMTELLGVPPNATLNPLPWINQLTQAFYQASGVPQIVVGGSGEMTEATAKICYLAFEQTIEEEQLYIKEQVLAQLDLEIQLEFPASLQNEVLSDTGKEESMQAATPEDTSAPPAEMTQGVAK